MKRQRSESAVFRKRRVYSYIRFSTPEQKLGDSLRRQMELAKAYADAHGFVFDEQLKDEGLSGYSGSHLKKGKLGRFLENVKSRKVPSDSILFVEELDRLSREEMTDALETIVSGLIKFGITIATPGGTYDRESLNNGGIWKLIAKLENAHEESRKKSERLGRAWGEKKRRAREEGLVLTPQVPHWLKVVDQRIVVIPEAVEAVRMIFKEAATLGRSRLVKKLNSEAPWMPPGRKRNGGGNGWRMSYVRKILTNRAVIGECQLFTKRGAGKRVPDGDPIPNYYPQIIERAVFFAMQRRIQENKAMNKGGRTGSASNLFTNLAKCAYCGGSMVFRDRGPKPKGGQSLVCDNAMRGHKCTPHSICYSEINETLLNNCPKLRPEEVLPNETERQQKCENLRMLLAGGERELCDIEGQVSNLMDQISRAKVRSIRDRYEARIGELEKRKATLDEQLEEASALLAQEELGREAFVHWQRDLEALKKAITPKRAIDARLRLQAHLKQFIAKIEIFADGYPKTTDGEASDSRDSMPAAEDLAAQFEAIADEYRLDDVRRSKHFSPFLRALTIRRMSKEGRFFRVHFKPKGFVDLAPPGSLASGRVPLNRNGNEWRSVHPDFETLWEVYLAKQKLNARALNRQKKERRNYAHN